MSVQERSAPAPLPSSPALAQEQAFPSSNPLGDLPTMESPVKKTGNNKKAPKKKAATKAKPAGPVDAPVPQRVRYRYEPYRKADPTPEPEGNLPADLEELETLDATAKMLYKSDREVLEYIEALNHRTAAVLEHVNRTNSQLRSCKGAMERIDVFVDQWQKIDDQWTHQQLFGEGPFEESSDEEDYAPYADCFSQFSRMCLNLCSTGTQSSFLRWSAAGAVPSPPSKNTFPSTFT
jgi:hypothetical protein